MNWRDDITDSLPEPRDDEPATLRSDIVDELSDHLSCALNRELHFTSDEKTAIQKVLDRFGDPRAIARKLWFDSMKEKLMTQRLMLMTSILAAIASMAACVMVYLVTQRSDNALQAVVARGVHTDEAILAKLEALVTRPVSVEFSPVKFRLVLGKADGLPAVGFKVSLSNQTHTNTNPERIDLEKVSDPNGFVDFGLKRYGDYLVMLKSPDGQYTEQNVTVNMGVPFDEVILCPERVPAIVDTEVAMEVDLLSELRDPTLRAECLFVRQSNVIGSLDWISRDNTRRVLIADGGMLIDGLGFAKSFYDEPSPIAGKAWTPLVRWPAESYHLHAISLIKVGSDGKGVRVGSAFSFGPYTVGSPHPGPKFEAKPGLKNGWRIAVPEMPKKIFRQKIAELATRPAEQDPAEINSEAEGKSEKK
ncbi:MAG: hypothetical protein AB7O26_07230 [Planctomycetaceae bacterium]